VPPLSVKSSALISRYHILRLWRRGRGESKDRKGEESLSRLWAGRRSSSASPTPPATETPLAAVAQRVHRRGGRMGSRVMGEKRLSILFLRKAQRTVGSRSAALDGSWRLATFGHVSAQAGRERGPLRRTGRWLLGYEPKRT
jgi:hypothetical protein